MTRHYSYWEDLQLVYFEELHGGLSIRASLADSVAPFVWVTLRLPGDKRGTEGRWYVYDAPHRQKTGAGHKTLPDAIREAQTLLRADDAANRLRGHP